MRRSTRRGYREILEGDLEIMPLMNLFVALIPASLKQASADRLPAMIAANGGRRATGFLGTRPLLPVLSALATCSRQRSLPAASVSHRLRAPAQAPAEDTVASAR